ncbi:MAG: TetR/AcrR family transcriptional regulator [Pseudomonadota bacterium]
MTRPQDPRAGYIAIASAQFARHGYHGASLAALAQASGVTKQALLHFFATKERLYAQVLEDLSKRLCAEIDAAAQPDPAAHLERYLMHFHAAALEQSDDVRLAMRALLDTDASARYRPLRPYLDRLIALGRRTPGGQHRSEAEILAWLSQMIGGVQYMAILMPAVAGMYGPQRQSDVAAQSRTLMRAQIRAFVRQPDR